MPPKFMNAKAAAAAERKEADASAKKSKQAKAEEDAYWQSAGEGKKSKAQAKKEAAGESAEEAQRRKAEAKLLAKQEEEEMATYGKKKSSKNPDTGKMTAFQIRKLQFAEKKRQEEEAKAKGREASKTVTEDEYASMVEQENTNRAEDSIDASGLDAAIAAMVDLSTGGGEGVDAHPEKRVKAAFMEFMEAEMPGLRKDKPGLKTQQYRDMLWKEFKKSPQNPMNAQR